MGAMLISPPACGRGRGWVCATMARLEFAPTPNPSRKREGN
jgi:hypothetical protein